MTSRSSENAKDEDAALWRFMQLSARGTDRNHLEHASELGILRLLGMTEALIAAHKAARLDGDGQTVALIEGALRHVGRRLEKDSVARHAADRDSAPRAG